MKPLQSLLFFRRKSNSLFLRLIAGFLCIILLLGSFTLYTLAESKKNVRQGIVQYNTLMIENTMNSYEKHLDLVRKQMSQFFLSEDVQRLQSNPKFTSIPQIIREISTFSSNPYLFIDNIVLYLKKDDLVIEKGTSTDAATMFNVFYTSKEYPLEFWRKQFDNTYSTRLLPSAHMINNMYRDSPRQIGNRIPHLFKNEWHNNLYMIVFLDADRMYNAFQQSIHDDFIVYGDGGETLYQTEGREPFLSYDDLKADGRSEFVKDGKYYFSKTGKTTGYQYVYRVPAEQIAYQTRLNVTLVAMMVTVIVLSLLIAIVFAVRINNPLRKVIESIRTLNEKQPFRSSISEFNIISDEILGIQLVRKQLGFINRLKAIRSHEVDGTSLEFVNKPFVFLLFQVQYHQGKLNNQISVEKWLYYIRTYIDSQLTPAQPDSLTFQIERNQILSLVFAERTPELFRLLGKMKAVFDHDKEYGIITIAVTSIYSDSEQLTVAYEEAQGLIGERRLVKETQIIAERVSVPASIGFSSDQDKEFEVNLREGNLPQLTALLERQFAKWQGKDMTASAIYRFAESMKVKIQSTLISVGLETNKLVAILIKAEEKIENCVTVSELEQLLLGWVTKAAETVKEKKEEKHQVTSFVIDYINEHLSEEIYLDVLAEKLKMSSGYLSSYFKGKTGKNIVDYLNETRIAKATSLLADNNIKIHNAAKEVGYQNITSFNRMFKKYTGMTPSEYRKQINSTS
ncbi:AraC-like DNA-binding protein [Paenibacillus endophyticus]|uniref:AraC-like DNA-binding protein n=1 Tax=Paenibacillus endophyticus TaxID=1294268 RepID=A0A7W5G812_9BACL|nr:helix-turn-helix domain-containing protein [Paenibacillus endophyticus]MBB3150549.1 AraC-like DNA-binding protein [Paenibacillus endophyticus]